MIVGCFKVVIWCCVGWWLLFLVFEFGWLSSVDVWVVWVCVWYLSGVLSWRVGCWIC